MELYKNVELKSLELYEEEHRGIKSYLMKAVYECTSKTKKVELVIPRIDLGIDPHHLPTIETEYYSGWMKPCNHHICNIISSPTPLRPDKNGTVYYEKVIEE